MKNIDVMNSFTSEQKDLFIDIVIKEINRKLHLDSARVRLKKHTFDGSWRKWDKVKLSYCIDLNDNDIEMIIKRMMKL